MTKSCAIAGQVAVDFKDHAGWTPFSNPSVEIYAPVSLSGSNVPGTRPVKAADVAVDSATLDMFGAVRRRRGRDARASSSRASNSGGPWLLPVHSAHVGQELEVHYRYHPYFDRKVLVRRVEQRATGQFFRVQFDNRRLEGVAAAERDKIVTVLAQILMQAAGLSVEELEDDQR